MRQAGVRLGSVRRAFATRGASSGADGSGAPQARRLALPLTVFTVILTLVLGASQALASKGVINFFGTTGASGGQFASNAGGPGGVAVNQNGTGGVAAGDVYVVDRGNNRIQQFSASGGFVRTFGLNVGGAGVNVCTASCVAGTASNAAGGLSAPQGVAINQSTGQVFVTDQINRRVDIFSATGTFEGAFGWGVDTGAGVFQFCTTASTCQAPAVAGGNAGQFGTAIGYPAVNLVNDNVLVADKTNRRVDEFSITGSPATAASFVRGYGFDVVTSGPDNNGTTNFEICNFAANPTDVCKQGGAGSAPGQFASANSPAALDIDSTGKAYVVDRGNNRVQKFSSSGDALATFATANLSSAPAPADVAVDKTNNHVFVIKPCSDVTCPGAAVASEYRVLEFDSGGTLLDTHVVGAGIISANGLAQASGSGSLYLSTSTTDYRGVFILGTLAPPTATMDPVTTFTGTAATFEGKVNPIGFETDYHFEYTDDTDFQANSYANATKVPAADESAGNGNVEVPVTQNATGLIGSTLYHVRLIATKHFLLGGVAAASATSTETTFTTPAAAPVVSGASASQVSDTAATLNASVNPENQATTYHFEYTDDTDFQANDYSNAISVPAPPAEASAGAGGANVGVAKGITDLIPATTYHFRLVATNPTDTAKGPDRSFATYPAPLAGLPDNRAYELVSPANAGGADVRAPAADPTRTASLPLHPASPTGERVLFESETGLPGLESVGFSSDPFVADRGASGWTTSYVGPPAASLAIPNFGLDGATPDLSRFFYQIIGTNLDPADTDPEGPSAAEEEDVYAREFDGAFTWLSRGTQQPPAFVLDPHPFFDGVSKDGSRIVFDWGRQLEPNAMDEHGNVYERSGNQTTVLSLDPGGTALAARFVGMSEDALTVAFSASQSTGEPQRIWVRHAGATVEASASQTADPAENVRYEGMSAGGSRVFLSTAQQLTADDTDTSRDLYVYKMISGTLERLSTGSGGSGNSDVCPANPLSSASQCDVAVAAVSSDGSRVYFLSPEVLDNTVVNGHAAVAGEPNLYLRDVGLGGQTRYVATLDRSDLADSNPFGERPANGIGLDHFAVDQPLNIESASGFRPARLTSDGVRLAFESSAELTGYDTTDLNDPALKHTQIYVYDAAIGTLNCASCRPDGTRSIGDARLERSPEKGFSSYLQIRYLSSGRNLAENGTELFFETPEPLVLGDSNGKVDVYAYNTQTGRASLISAGTGTADSHYLDSSADGRDVFFTTADTLVSQDHNGPSIKLYDARVEGGFTPESQPAASCSGDGCQPQPSGTPTLSSGGSNAFVGPGNTKPRHHKPHKHKHHKRHHHRTNHNRGGAK